MTHRVPGKSFSISGTTPSSQSVAQLGSSVSGLDQYSCFKFWLVISVRPTGGAVTFYLQSSFNGTTWFDVASLATINTGASGVTVQVPTAPVGTGAPLAVGSGLTPAVSGNALVPVGPMLRILASGASGTTAGATVTIYGWAYEPPAIGAGSNGEQAIYN